MIKITICLDGKTFNAYLKRKEYIHLTGQVKALAWWVRLGRWWKRIINGDMKGKGLRWVKKQLNRIKYKEVRKNEWVRRGKQNA